VQRPRLLLLGDQLALADAFAFAGRHLAGRLRAAPRGQLIVGYTLLM
jgi:hypothetical protein